MCFVWLPSCSTTEKSLVVQNFPYSLCGQVCLQPLQGLLIGVSHITFLPNASASVLPMGARAAPLTVELRGLSIRASANTLSCCPSVV